MDQEVTGDLVIPSTITHQDITYTIVEIADYAFTYEIETEPMDPFPLIRGYDLTSVIIPDTVIRIGNNAFSNCNVLVSIIIPSTVTYIGESAFSRCSSLEQVNIPYGVTEIRTLTFEGCTSLTEISIPESIVIIGIDAFSSSGLATVTIPDSVQSIGQYGFMSCKQLEEITIPSSVNSIGSMAFAYLNNLIKVTSYMETPPNVASNIAFYGSKANANLYIPFGTIQAYSDAGWTDFKAIIEVTHICDAGAWHTTLEATCEVIGTKELRCTECSKVLETDTIDALEHDWTKSDETIAACVFDAIWHYECTACEETKDEPQTDTATGHTYGQWTIINLPTSIKNGSRERICHCEQKETTELLFVSNGVNGEIAIDNATGYVIVVSGDYAKFDSIKVGNITLVKDTDYTVASGSTIITITPAGLKKIGTGQHEITVLYSDSSVAFANLKVNNITHDEETMFQKFFSFLEENILIVVGLSILLGTAIIFLFIGITVKKK